MSRPLPYLLVLLLSVACGEPPRSAPTSTRASSTAPPQILATTLPLTTFAERLLDGDPPVRWIVPAGERADVWRPGRNELGELQRATLVLTNGAGLESWLDTVSLPATRIVDASADFADALLRREGLAHTHGLGGERSRPPADPYVWLDLDLAARQVHALRATFASRWPDRAATFEARARALADDLGALEDRLGALAHGGAPPRLLAAAPVYAYLGRAQGWTVRDVAIEAGRPVGGPSGGSTDGLSADALRAGIEEALRAGATPVLLWPRTPAATTAQLVAERHGVRSVVFSPGLTRSPGERERGVDYLDVLDAGVTALEEALGQ